MTSTRRCGICSRSRTLEVMSVAGAYLVAAAPPNRWERKQDVAELYAPGEQEWYARFLLDRYADAWARLLRDGVGRPRRVPRLLLLELLLSVPAEHYPPYELRLLRVAKTDEWVDLEDGWPTRADGGILDEELTLVD
jgi:hypothetical protein